jgi:hypothetical protein
LNMDHHCVFLKHCIGFYNRKFFFHALLYGVLSLLVVVLECTPEALSSLTVSGFSGLFGLGIPFAYTYSYSLLLIVPLTQFLWFHLRLMMKNSTAIEQLQWTPGSRSPFDVGCCRNLAQVFGPVFCMWCVPIRCSFTQPIGDGLSWQTTFAAE